MRVALLAASVLLLDCTVGRLSGTRPRQPRLRIGDVTSAPGLHARRDWNVTEGVFEQWIDHANHSVGTFEQHFWWSADHYGGDGSPIIFFCPGEESAEDFLGYVSIYTITGMYAQAVGGAVVMLEHRYFGRSSPFTVLSTANLTYLTLQNAMADVTRFASTVRLPFNLNGTSAPGKAPWLYYGGSYSGNLAAWTSELAAPSPFWAYNAASAPVEAVTDWWQYFDFVRRVMPRNCSADVVKVVHHVDQVLTAGTDAERHALKAMFGLEDLASDDFGQVLLVGPWSLQGQDFVDDSGFYRWCDYVENAWPGSDNAVPGAEGVGLEKALAGYAKWIRDDILPGSCQKYGYPEFNGTDVKCHDSHDPSSPLYMDLSLNNTSERQYNWLLCNYPLEFWQTGAPPGTPSMASRLITVKYWRDQCALYFPPENGATYGIAAGKTAADLNALTGGWSNVGTKRMLWSVGELDPSRTAGVASDWRPGGPLVSTKDMPIVVVPGGTHCTDALSVEGDANAGVRKAQEEEVAIMKGWVHEFYKQKNMQRSLES